MDFKYSWKKCKAAAWEKELHWEEWPVLTNWEWQEILVKLSQSGSAVSSPAGHRANKRLVNFQLKMKQPTTIIFVVFFSQLTVKSLHILLGYSGQNWSKDHKTQRPKFQRANILTDRCIKNFVIISGDLNIKPPLNKCIGDDTKAAARQSPHCLKNNKIWRMELLHPTMWNDHDIDYVRWLHPAVWLWDDMPWNWPKRSPYWNSTSGFDFDHITAVDISFYTSL